MKIILAAAIVLAVLPGRAGSQRNNSTGAGGRSNRGFVYDSARKKFLLFGGIGGRGEPSKGDTWEWDGAKWTQLATAGPSPRGAMAMAYHSKRKRVVLFGGLSNGRPVA